MKENSELKAIARSQLQGSWLDAVIMLLVYCLIIGSSSITAVGPLVIGGPLMLGLTGYYVKKARGEPVKLEDLFEGFKLFGPSFLLYLLYSIFLMLWTCLFIVPGIIKGLSYSMSFYILRDNPKIEAMEAITQSRKMMVGYKGKLFGLYLSFIGWALLCCLSLGVGFLWLGPYIYMSVTNFYEDLKQNQTAESTN